MCSGPPGKRASSSRNFSSSAKPSRVGPVLFAISSQSCPTKVQEPTSLSGSQSVLTQLGTLQLSYWPAGQLATLPLVTASGVRGRYHWWPMPFWQPHRLPHSAG